MLQTLRIHDQSDRDGLLDLESRRVVLALQKPGHVLLLLVLLLSLVVHKSTIIVQLNLLDEALQGHEDLVLINRVVLEVDEPVDHLRVW